MYIPLKTVLAGAMILLVSGCGFTSAPERAYHYAQPQTAAVRNLTSFSDSLRCMDGLFAAFGVRDIGITTNGIPDATGKISVGTKDMLISAISKMSVKSKAFAFVDFDQSQEDIKKLFELAGATDTFKVPRYYLRGAITQLDENVIAESVGGSVAMPQFKIGVSRDQVVSVISVDMNVGELATRQIIPGVSSSNSIVVRRNGNAGTTGGTIGKSLAADGTSVGLVGLTFNISFNAQEGIHQATRTLIDLSAIELMGMLTKVPYWRCLQIEQTNPMVLAKARDWFLGMSQQKRVLFVQRALASTGHYHGVADGVLDASTRNAVARFQADNGLIANGRIDFDLYRTLIGKDLALGVEPSQASISPSKSAKPEPLRVKLSTLRGQRPVYHPKESLKLKVETTEDAHVYCFYRDARRTITRIFPNKFHPDSFVPGGRPANIPGSGSNFDIVFDKAGVEEEIMCVASPRDLGLWLPDPYRLDDFTPLPVQSVDEVIKVFLSVDQTASAHGRLKIKVTDQHS